MYVYQPPSISDPFHVILRRKRTSKPLLMLMTGCSSCTASRWIKDNSAPVSIRRLVIVSRGDLGAIAPAWSGWRIADGLLWSPADVAYSPDDLASLHYLRQIARLKPAKVIQFREPVQRPHRRKILDQAK